MIFAEPPPTQADLHFRVLRVPVRVHPLFWLVGLLLGLSAGQREPTAALLMIVVFFVSILVHELGHAALQRKFGGRPRIVLHGFGGLAICDDCDRSTRSQILISLAGPIAGFLLAAVVMLVVALTSRDLQFVPLWSAEPRPPLAGWAFLGLGELYFTGYPSGTLNDLAGFLLQVNIVWGILNLLPIYPLDGGRVARELLSLGHNTRQGIERSLQLSIGVAASVAVVGLVMFQMLFLAVLFGYLAYTNYRTLQTYTGRGPGMGW